MSYWTQVAHQTIGDNVQEFTYTTAITEGYVVGGFYYFKIRAMNSNGYSEFSDLTSV
jgi:hypothetical protein